MQEVYIVSMARTPIGSFGGSLSKVAAIDLGATVISEVVKRAGISADEVQEVFMGNVLQANEGQAPARQAAIKAGIPYKVPCTTVNKVCASGMKAVMLASQGIRLGDIDVAVAGGMENMSQAPYYVTKGRFGMKYGNQTLVDAIVRDGLQDPYKGCMMGNTGELCAEKYEFSREDQDNYAIESYRRAEKAKTAGIFDKEIVQVAIPQRRGDDVQVTEDDEPNNVRYDKIPKLRPAFEKEGTITAANASKINDGAAAVLLMSGKMVEKLGLTPLAKVLSYADAAQEPDWFTTTPAQAIPKAIKKANLNKEDIGIYEINEAFSVVSLANIKELALDADKVNIHGGAVSLGHPIGVSGTRIIMSLISALQAQEQQYGAAGICNGGGGASAMVIEKV